MRRIVLLICRPFAAAVFLAVVVSVGAREARAQTSDVPELKVLDRWRGDWIFEISFEKTKTQPEGGHATGTMIGKWFFKDRWLMSNVRADQLDALILQTYDLQKRSYVCWIHGEDGQTIEFVATWDPASSTLTYKPAHAGELSASMKIKFVDEDHSQLEFVIKDASGTVTFHPNVKFTRWKYPLRRLNREELETDMAVRMMLRQVKLTDLGGGHFTGTGRDIQDRLIELEVTQEEHRRSWKTTRRSASGTEVGNSAVGW
jgi:hypothetical protein